MEKLLTVKDLSSYLNIHPNTIYKWKDQGKIPYSKINGQIRFIKDEIDKWLDQSKSKIYPLFESLSKVDLALEQYDKLFLKGDRMSQKGKTWSYPFGSVFLRLTKTAKERWYIYYRVEGKRVRQVVENAQSRADALKVLQIRVADAFRGKHGFKKEDKIIKFEELADLYLENFKTKKSAQEDRCRMEAHLKPFFGKMELKEISPLLIQKYRTKRLNAGVKYSTTNRELALLKVMFSKAIDWGYAKMNPVKKVKFFSEKDTQKERILSKEEETRLLKTSSEDLKPIILTALHTGMRRKEILNLRWKDVELDKRQLKALNTKGGKNRIIPINDVLLGQLIKLKKMYGKKEFVFPIRQFRGIRTAFEKARKKAAIDDLRFHDLRHTFATRLVENGVDLITVKELLGHHSVIVTQRYTHSNAEQKRKAVDVLSKICPHIVPTDSIPSAHSLVSNAFSVN